MALIPQNNFGQAVARSGPMVNVQRGNVLGDAAQRTTQIAGDVVNDMAAQETKNAEAQKRAQATLALAKAQNDLHDAHDEIARRVTEGEISTDQAGPEFQKAASKVRETTFSGWQPEQRDLMDAHLTGTQGTLQRSLAGVVVKRRQQETAATIDQFGEQVSREASRAGPSWASQKYDAMVDFTGPAAGLNAAQMEKLKQGFKERVHANFFQSAAVGALTRGDADALGQLMEKINGPEGDALDPAKRQVLTHQVFGWQQHVLAQRDRASNAQAEEFRKRTNEAVDTYNKATDVAMGGGYFSPEFITDLVTKASGTTMEGPVQNLIASQRQIAGFATMPAPERQALIERQRAARATPGVGTDPLGDKLLTALETMDGKLRAAAKENPWAAAQRAGVIQDAQQINPGDPAGAIAVVQGRMQRIRDIEAWTGEKVSPLQPQEVEQVGKMVRALPLDQAATMLGNFGAAVGDSERVAALARQLHDKDGALGLAMLYANAGTTEGRHTAELVLRGEQAMKDKTAAADPARETGWRSTIAKQVRGAYSNREAEDAAVQAAFLIAAGKYAEGKGTDLDLAVRLATGGIAERNGQKFPLPYGMTERDFDKRLEGIKPADLAPQAADGQVFVGRTAMPLDAFVASLPKATLVHAGQGLYNVRAGAAVVTNSAGRRITLRIAP